VARLLHNGNCVSVPCSALQVNVFSVHVSYIEVCLQLLDKEYMQKYNKKYK